MLYPGVVVRGGRVCPIPLFLPLLLKLATPHGDNMEVHNQVGGVDQLPDLVSVPVANHGVELAGLHHRPGHTRHDTDFQPPLYSAESYGAKDEDEKADDAVINLTDEPAVVPFDIKSGAQLPDIDGAIDEPRTLTVRAILVGSCLGAIVGASNI